MLFIRQGILIILRKEGPMERAALTERVIEQMQIGDLVQYIDSTLNVMIGTNNILLDEDGKLYTNTS